MSVTLIGGEHSERKARAERSKQGARDMKRIEKYAGRSTSEWDTPRQQVWDDIYPGLRRAASTDSCELDDAHLLQNRPSHEPEAVPQTTSIEC